MKRSKWAVITLCVLLVMPSIATAQQKASRQMPLTVREQNRPIKAGDTLDVNVWQHSNMDMTVIVEREGFIQYPFLGIVDVHGKTIKEVEVIITDGLDPEYIIGPKVSVRYNQQSVAFFIYGEVGRPGTYMFQGDVDVLKAIVMAGGFTAFASKKVRIIRKDESGNETETTLNVKKLVRAMENRNEYMVEPGDTIIVSRSWF